MITVNAALLLSLSIYLRVTKVQVMAPFDGLCVTSSEPVIEISNNVVCRTSKGSDQPAHTHSLIRAFACRLNIL